MLTIFASRRESQRSENVRENVSMLTISRDGAENVSMRTISRDSQRERQHADDLGRLNEGGAALTAPAARG